MALLPVTEDSNLDFGKHKGLSIKDIVADHPDYMPYLTLFHVEYDDDDRKVIVRDVAASLLEELLIDIQEYVDTHKQKLDGDSCLLDPGWWIALERTPGTFGKMAMLFVAKSEIDFVFKCAGSSNAHYSAKLYLVGAKAAYVDAARKYCDAERLCLKCFRKLTPVGHSRENGRDHPDWATRTLHKKCYSESLAEGE